MIDSAVKTELKNNSHNSRVLAAACERREMHKSALLVRETVNVLNHGEG